ncbi:DNA phosphorothioation-dependent restriction protein DptH [Thiomicrorhabdus indica]|uniref:DNA phosphorothioation-dependent restriction protein DptH n=1 Tax=Thiomicrorhabdus indica TaxID=2267253 RepID=UPI00197FFE61|nr:DNA phosphorothioation-dependent restriction protein DptH [Thiomicrorhabdus indica]
MSNQPFNDFLVNNMVSWLEKYIQAGYRYRFFSDNKKQIVGLLDSLKVMSQSSVEFSGIKLPVVHISGVDLIFVNDVEGEMNENFISNLRDSTKPDADVLNNHALLVLHQSSLDTLINSATDLSIGDGPLNPVVAQRILEEKSKNSSHPKLFNVLIENQARYIEATEQSIFGYESIFNSINSDELDFKSLGLFEDKDLQNLYSVPKIRKRIEENKKLYEEVEKAVVEFPNELEDQLTKYSPEFVAENLTVDIWDSVTFTDLQNEIQKNRNTSLTFDNNKFITTDDFYIRDDSTNKAGQRQKNIIVFSDDEDVRMSFKFNVSGLSSSDFSFMESSCNLTAENLMFSNRSATVNFKRDDTPVFFRLRVKTNNSSDTHFFKVLVIPSGMFNLEDIKNNYIVKPKEKSLLLKLDSFQLNFAEAGGDSKPIQLAPNATSINIDQTPFVDFYNLYQAHDEVSIAITNGMQSINLLLENELSEDSLLLPLILDAKRFDCLFDQGVDAEFNSIKNKAILDNREYNLRGERSSLVHYEYRFIDEGLYSIASDDINSIEVLADIAPEVHSSYKALFQYFESKKTVPSLCAWNNEVRSLAIDCVNSFLRYVGDLQKDADFNLQNRIVFEVGMVNIKQRQFLSPFSPLILAYIVHLTETVVEDVTGSFKDLYSISLKRLNAKGLFPYLFIDHQNYSYTQAVEENQLWLEFIPNEESELSYISKLTAEKMFEFKAAFSSLFSIHPDRPLIINSINNGSNEELFEGIISFFKKTIETPTPLIVNLYDDQLQETAFDVFSDLDSVSEIQERFKLRGDNVNALIDLLRTNISYSKKHSSEDQDYCDLSFFKNNEKVQVRDSNVNNRLSGLAFNGLISGESSEKNGENYFSGFGLKNVPNTDLPIIKVAKAYNAIQRSVYEPGTAYDPDRVMALMISDNFKNLLKKSYSSAYWTVIIDPKVTLDFFDSNNELILIHYSDQYSSSANYDAITVTAKSDLYADVVGSKKIISEFNAFNGEWLIKMVTDPETIKKEKNGVISAYKFITAALSKSNVTWVPISVAEMIRVSGNVGLSMSKGDFSRYNESQSDSDLKLGPISDDILLVGFSDEGVILYPVEVKSGSGDIKKARKQALALQTYLYEHLFAGDSFKSKLLKSLFIRQVFMQIEKYKLYNVFDEDYFEDLIGKRERLLDGSYKLIKAKNHSGGAVVAFLTSLLDTNLQFIDNVLEVKMPYDFINSMLESSFGDVRSRILNGEFGIGNKLDEIQVKFSSTVDACDKPSGELDDNSVSELVAEGSEIEEEPKFETSLEKVSNQEKQGPLEVKFGSGVIDDKDIIWYPTDTTKTLNTNTGIIGTMGTGKTQFTKSLIAQLQRNQHNNVNGTPIGILIFDYKGDYIKEEFTEPTSAKVLDPYHLPFNPLALFGEKPLLPVHTTNLFKTTLAKAFGLGTVQQSTLSRIVLEAYDRAGINRANKTTWSKPAPTIQDVWEVFINEEDTKQDSLYASLQKLIDFQVFEPLSENTKTLYDFVDGITVLNLSGYDPDLQNLIVAITLDIFYTQMHIKGSSKLDGDYRQITKMVLVDEADNFMSQDFESLKKILKEGREFGVGTILSTQQLTHFKTSEDNYANYIQSWIVHQVSTIKSSDITSIFNISNKQEAESLMEQIRTLEKHYSIYVDGDKKMTKMRDLAFWELDK